jgi:hypothetical protein
VGGRLRLTRPRPPDIRVVAADDFEKLANWVDGTLKIMRRIAKIAARTG